MQPTIDVQLGGIDRLLRDVEATEELPETAGELLSHARRLVGQVSRSWASLMAFHYGDNLVMTILLSELAPLVPALHPDIDRATAPVPAALDPIALAERNTALRGVLTDVITALPDSGAGAEARAKIADYLLDRITAEPR